MIFSVLCYLYLFCLGIGAGLESMTANPMAWEGSVNPKVFFPLFINSSPQLYYIIFILVLGNKTSNMATRL